MARRVEGKVAIVTGAAAGMGAAHALALAREGADVTAVDIARDQPLSPVAGGTMEALNKLVQEMTSFGQRAIAITCDVSKASEVEKMAKTVTDQFGKIDILVNNAGVVTSAPLVDLTEEAWDWVMDVNIKGMFLCCKYVLPHMIAQKSGKIVNIGSVNGREGMPGMTHYCCSKAAVHMLTDTLSKEVAEHNINVNCVAPGTEWGTPMVDWAAGLGAPEGGDPYQAYLDLCKRMYTFGREQTPEDIANAMLFLVSEESRNITGYTIYVDGGHKIAF
jgi:meso-butanediol dehydrogenase/(S,S)-butanediol dehydrogenase/diacetyl reductase